MDNQQFPYPLQPNDDQNGDTSGASSGQNPVDNQQSFSGDTSAQPENQPPPEAPPQDAVSFQEAQPASGAGAPDPPEAGHDGQQTPPQAATDQSAGNDFTHPSNVPLEQSISGESQPTPNTPEPAAHQPASQPDQQPPDAGPPASTPPSAADQGVEASRRAVEQAYQQPEPPAPAGEEPPEGQAPSAPDVAGQPAPSGPGTDSTPPAQTQPPPPISAASTDAPLAHHVGETPQHPPDTPPQPSTPQEQTPQPPAPEMAENTTPPPEPAPAQPPETTPHHAVATPPQASPEEQQPQPPEPEPSEPPDPQQLGGGENQSTPSSGEEQSAPAETLPTAAFTPPTSPGAPAPAEAQEPEPAASAPDASSDTFQLPTNQPQPQEAGAPAPSPAQPPQPQEQREEHEQEQTGDSAASGSRPSFVSKITGLASRFQKAHLKPLISAAVFGIIIFGIFNAQVILGQMQYLTTPSGGIEAPSSGNIDAQAPAGDEPRIIIPQLDVNVPVVYDEPSFKEEKVQKALERGVVHYGTTALPGENGNSVIVGHSSNNWWDSGKYKFAFILLDKLQNGDEIILHYEGTRYVYEVHKKQVVQPDNTEVLKSTQDPILTLITCTPPGTSWKRLIVQAEQVTPDPSQNTNPQSGPNEEAERLPSDSSRSFFEFVGDLF